MHALELDLEYVPAVHGVHAVALICEKVPALQGCGPAVVTEVHGAGQNIPTGHSRQENDFADDQ